MLALLAFVFLQLIFSESSALTCIELLTNTDNYQGEESDIVIASLTRSNNERDIGFMIAPERLNVLLSRARQALIIIGNMDTFKENRRGKKTWSPLFDFLVQHHHIYDGLPIQCERHPSKRSIIREIDAFEAECPDGGCDQPWYVYQLIYETSTDASWKAARS